MRLPRLTGFLVGFLSGAWSMVADWRFWLAGLFLLWIVGCIQEVTHAETKQPPQS